MTDGSILLFPPGSDIVGQAIKDVTDGPAHVATVLAGMIWDVTVWHQDGRWRPVLGWRLTSMADLSKVFGTGYKVRVPVNPWSDVETQRALEVGLAQVNSRRWYNIPLLLLDAVLYPLRKRGIKWDPFKRSKEYVCSSGAGLLVRATGRDPWPGVDTEELAPEDFVMAKEWRDT
jgi:hypothetical protein